MLGACFWCNERGFLAGGGCPHTFPTAARDLTDRLLVSPGISARVPAVAGRLLTGRGGGGDT